MAREKFFFKEELIKEFSLERIQKSAGMVNTERLDWYNGQYIKTEPKKNGQKYFWNIAGGLACRTGKLEKKNAAENSSYWLKIAELEKDRITKLSDT